ncbi:acyltransferase [Microbacterium sp. HMH0099]|uniref:acyltransferase n=1 Tax=Microbacterium sp. HMH0099 TaxID=3414026 RepID=UPI003BF70B1C
MTSLNKLLGALRGVILSISRCVRIDGLVRVDGLPSIRSKRGGLLTIANRARIFPDCRFHLDTPAAQIHIGARTYLNRRVEIFSEAKVSIGADCAISWDVCIVDTDYHDGLSRQRSAPVHIGDHVLIGARSTILKGVTIGNGAVVAAGSIVTRNVPAFSMVAGAPAKIIRDRVEWE